MHQWYKIYKIYLDCVQTKLAPQKVSFLPLLLFVLLIHNVPWQCFEEAQLLPDIIWKVSACRICTVDKCDDPCTGKKLAIKQGESGFIHTLYIWSAQHAIRQICWGFIMPPKSYSFQTWLCFHSAFTNNYQTIVQIYISIYINTSQVYEIYAAKRL